MSRNVLDRRGFLRRAVAASAVATAAGRGRTRAAAPQGQVLVIGAGMAGVAAARMLHDHGYGVTVLEGRPDRIGGRIWTSRAWNDAPVDLGASWLTHATINPLAQLAKSHGVKMVPSDLMNVALRDVNGQQLPSGEVEDLWALYFGTYARVKAIAFDRASRGLPDWPASAAFDQVFAQERPDRVTKRKLDFFLDYAIQEPQCSALSDLSLYNWDDDFVFVQLYTAVFPQGYKQLVDILAAPLDIRLGHAVQLIEYGATGVVVHTNQGIFRAPRAIVTLPHAVLKNGNVAFQPMLPTSKRAAIGRLHTGLADKFYFRFPFPFWDVNADTVGRVPPTPDAGWDVWLNFYKYTGKPILMAFNHTGLAARLEGMNDAQVLNAAMSALRAAYGPNIPNPIPGGFQRSRWLNDPFARGTYPHVPPATSTADYAELGQPVGPLGFAGDSTEPDFPNLVFGAYRSGVREANRIMGLL